jgi:hypothetical protein
MTQIIGLGHYSRTGKDTFANYLIDALRDLSPGIRVGRKSFATKLKDICHDLYGWAGMGDEDFYNVKANEHLRTVKLPYLNMTPVEVWVKMGTLAVRDKVYDPTWVDYILENDWGLDVMIIPDVRFFNEIEALCGKDAHLIKIVRPGYGPKMTVADLALYDYTEWHNIIGDHREPDGMENLNRWAKAYAKVILGHESWETVLRSTVAREAALACEVRPSLVEVLDVFEAAGLSYAHYRTSP